MKYKKVYLFGGPGFGKTTIGVKLSSIFGYKLISLGTIMYKNGEKIKEKDMVLRLKEEIKNEPMWLVEGGCLGWSDFLFKQADLIIMLKVSLVIALARIIKRYFGYRVYSFQSTLKLCIRTLPAYYSKNVVEYPYKIGAKNIIEIGSMSFEKIIKKLC